MRGARNAYRQLRYHSVERIVHGDDQDYILNIRFVYNPFGVIGRFHMDYQLVLF